MTATISSSQVPSLRTGLDISPSLGVFAIVALTTLYHYIFTCLIIYLLKEPLK